MKSKEVSALTVKREFKPKLAHDVEIKFFKEDERGKFYLMRNEQTLDFIKVHEYAYEAIKLFDGTRTIDEIETKLRKLGISLETQRLLRFLAKEGFIKNLPQHHKKRRDEEKWYSFKMKLTTLKEEHMTRLGRVFSFVKTLPFKVFYFIFCAAGLVIFFYDLPSLLSDLGVIAKLELPLYVFLASLAAFYVLRVLHELSHALAYYFQGGKSVEMGIEFHFLMPLAYTDTPDVYWMKSRERIMVFAAGPLSTLFFAEIFALLFFLGVEPRILWAVIAFFLHIDILMCFIPVIRTDGYYIVQTSLKFPNLLEHGMSNLRKIFHLIFRKTSLEDYREYISDYSARERKVLALYTLIFPVVLLTLVYFGVILTLKAGLIAVIFLTPQILMGTVADAETYIIWLLYLTALIFMLYGLVGAILRLLRKQRF